MRCLSASVTQQPLPAAGRARFGSKVWGLLIVACLLAGCHTEPTDTDEVMVFAAASLTDALETLAGRFEAAHPGTHVVLNLAATSTLARQIDQGARADVFFSANTAWMDYLIAHHRVVHRVDTLLQNRLVVAGRAGHHRLAGLADLMQAARIALADPTHVPAGVYAQEGLACAGLWEAVAPHVVPMLDVRAALLAVRHGAADLAVVYASDVLADAGVEAVLAWPPACQPTIHYTLARLSNAPNASGAERLIRFLNDPAQADVWARFGFIPQSAQPLPDAHLLPASP